MAHLDLPHKSPSPQDPRSDSCRILRHRIAARRAMGKSEQEAIQLAETVDVDRAAFIKQYFNVEWPARHFFHLMINSTIGDEEVVRIILNAAPAHKAIPSVNES